MAVVLAVAALACWLGKSPASPGAPSTDGRVAAGPAQAGHSPAMRPVRSEPVTGPSGAAYYARAIETIRTGQRVLARNPELAGGELPDAPVDPATWVKIRLRMPKPTGDFVEITLLRPVEWLAEHLAQTTALDGEYPRALAEARGTDSTSGSTTVSSVMPTGDPPEPSPGMIEPIMADNSPGSPWIFLTLPELEAVGPAEIVGVGPCPELEPGEGRLVTGTFSHQSGEVFDIAVDGLTEPIGCTGAHPFWSEDRHAFIPARDLRPRETLRTESGTHRQITRITPRRGPPVSVFNFEVDAEHVYYVSVDGVLVHNAYGDIPGEATISLKFIEGMNARDFARKAKSLQELGEAGELIRVMNPVARDPSVTANYRQDMINRIWQQYGQSNRDFANTLIDRVKRRMSPDHIHELQLGGSDVITNLRFMDRFTNWQIGTQQIRSQLRDLPVGTIIRVKIE